MPAAQDIERELSRVEGKFGGLEASNARRLRALEEEKTGLKRLLADTMLDNGGLKNLLSKET